MLNAEYYSLSEVKHFLALAYSVGYDFDSDIVLNGKCYPTCKASCFKGKYFAETK